MRPSDSRGVASPSFDALVFRGDGGDGWTDVSCQHLAAARLFAWQRARGLQNEERQTDLLDSVGSHKLSAVHKVSHRLIISNPISKHILNPQYFESNMRLWRCVHAIIPSPRVWKQF